MKPRRWLAYKIELNDLLPAYAQIIERFAASEIPLDGTFGSNTEPGTQHPGILVALGPAVEPARLLEILDLLEGLDQTFLTVHKEAEHSKVIFIGSLNLNREPMIAVDSALTR